MNPTEFSMRAIRKIYRKLSPPEQKINDHGQGSQFLDYVELFDQDANDYIREILAKGGPCMVSKFGTIELAALAGHRFLRQQHYSWHDFKVSVKGKYPPIGAEEPSIKALCSNAGFFPDDSSLMPRFYDINVEAMKQIDVLGSYIRDEKMFADELSQARRVNLDGYYAPYYYKSPWTKILEGKKVLVIHPFAKDIYEQYTTKKTKIWEDPDVLPEFDLKVYKAVQSMLGIKTEYNTWFDALKKMEDDIATIDFDIALIGCGAYGMPLAAYCKKLGKQAIHLAGWTQVLFGIIGERWQNNPRVAPMMNEYWIHPSKENIPTEAKKIENGCYW